MTNHDPQLSDADPSLGLPVRFAMGWYGEQQFARRYVDLNVLRQMSRASFAEFQSEHLRLQRMLLNDIAAQLRSGQLNSMGFRPGQLETVLIPREWWTTATIDVDTNTAEGNGVTLSGLLIFERFPPMNAGPASKDVEIGNTERTARGFAGRPDKSRSLLEAEMQDRASRGELSPRLASEVRELLKWLEREHPDDARPKQKSAENSFRDLYRGLSKHTK